MTLIDHTEDEDMYPSPPIFETDDVLPPDLIRKPKGGDREGPKGDAIMGPHTGGPETASGPRPGGIKGGPELDRGPNDGGPEVLLKRPDPRPV